MPTGSIDFILAPAKLLKEIWNKAKEIAKWDMTAGIISYFMSIATLIANRWILDSTAWLLLSLIGNDKITAGEKYLFSRGKTAKAKTHLHCSWKLNSSLEAVKIFSLHSSLIRCALITCVCNLQCGMVILMASHKATHDVGAKTALIYPEFQLFQMT